jgi:hypothetical protein
MRVSLGSPTSKAAKSAGLGTIGGNRVPFNSATYAYLLAAPTRRSPL